MKSFPITRRTLLKAAVAIPISGNVALASSRAAYSLALRPARGLLGEAFTAELKCVASAPAEVSTFDDASLMLELQRMPASSEPEQAFPNRGSAQRGAVMIRTAPTGRRRLARGERTMREIDLVSLFPSSILDTGEFSLTYEIGVDGALSKVWPARLTIESGPQAVPALFKLLDHPDAGIRARGAGLLHRMTAHVVGYDPNAAAAERAEATGKWRRWWDANGRQMVWNYFSLGATFGVKAAPPPTPRRSRMVGGLAYQRRPLGSESAKAITSALAEWQRSPSSGADALRARTFIADQSAPYPEDDTVLEPTPQIAAAIEATLQRLAELAASISPEWTGAQIILATALKMPSPVFVGALSAVQSGARKLPASWRQAESLASGMLDLLDSGRVPMAVAK